MDRLTRARLAVARWLLRGTGWHAEQSESWWEIVCSYAHQRRKRRRLLTRLCQERGYDRLLAASRGLTHYRRNTPIVTDPAAYQPADHCELSGTTPREEAL